MSPSSCAHRLGLGTAQIGLDYGIANATGKPKADDAVRLLHQAWEWGISVVDTAPAYGDAERVVGTALRGVVSCRLPSLRIVTKLPPCEGEPPSTAAADLLASLKRSLDALALDRIHALLVHHADDLWGPWAGPLREALQEAKMRGWVNKVGFSCYDPDEAVRALDILRADLVQVPLNLLDQRMRDQGILGKMKARSVEIHVRSCFLQGLLYLDPDRLPSRLGGARGPLLRMAELAKTRGWTVPEMALGFCLGVPEVDCVLVGVESVEQLRTLAAAASPLDPDDFASLVCLDPAVIDPRRWKP